MASHNVLTTSELVQTIVSYQEGIFYDILSWYGSGELARKWHIEACVYPYPPKNFLGRRKYNPLCLAILSGDLTSVERILQCQPYLLSAESIEYALAAQQASIAAFLLKQKFTPCKFQHSENDDERIVQFILFAIRQDNVDIFKLLKEFFNGEYENPLVDCFLHAMHRSHFNCALLLYEWHREQIWRQYDVVQMAAECGHLDLIIRLHHENARFTIHTMDQAAEFGHLSIVQFLHEHRTEGCTTEAMDKAAANDHLDVVKFLHAHRTEGCTSDALIHAIHNEVAELVEFLICNCPQAYTPDALYMAVVYNYSGIVKNLLETKKFEFSAKAFDVAYSNDRADFIVWFIQSFPESIPADTLVRQALEDARFRVVYALVAAGYPIELPANMVRCIVHPQALDLFQWLVNKGIALQPQWMDLAASHGTLELVKFFHVNCTAGCTTDALDGAAKKNKFAIVKFLIDNRSEGCTNAAFDGAIKKNAPELFDLLLKHYPDKYSNIDINAIFESKCAEFIIPKCLKYGVLQPRDVILDIIDHKHIGLFTTVLPQCLTSSVVENVMFLAYLKHRVGFTTMDKEFEPFWQKELDALAQKYASTGPQEYDVVKKLLDQGNFNDLALLFEYKYLAASKQETTERANAIKTITSSNPELAQYLSQHCIEG